MPFVTKIEKVGRSRQKCISVSASDGLFVLGNGIITHNSPDKLFNFFSKLRERISNRFQNNYFARMILDFPALLRWKIQFSRG